jgi:hypothetical protein
MTTSDDDRNIPSDDDKKLILSAISEVYRRSSDLNDAVHDLNLILNEIDTVKLKEQTSACFTGSNAMTHPCKSVLGGSC